MAIVHDILRVVFVLLVSTACVRVPEADDKEVASIVHQRISKEIHWQKEDEGSFTIERLLSHQLQLDEAMQIALLNNPRIQASFEELGIAQADLIQAGLFRNPMLAGFVRFPVTNGSAINTEFSATQGFLELYLMPLRKKVAAREFERVQLDIAHGVLEVAFDVEETFYALQGELQKLELLQQIVEIRSLNQTIAKRQYQAGNSNELEWQNHIRGHLEAKLAIADSESKIAQYRQKMNLLLGLPRTLIGWNIENRLPEFSEIALAEDLLEKRALNQRFDLAAYRLQVKRLFEMGATKEWWAYTDPSVGVSYEKDSDGTKVLGPTFAFALPFFDHGQADRARLLSCLKQSRHELVAKELAVLTEVQLACEMFNLNQARVDFLQRELLPLHESITASAQDFYNAMGLGVYSLLQKKEQQLQRQIDYVVALQEFWHAKVTLNRAVGGGAL